MIVFDDISRKCAEFRFKNVTEYAHEQSDCHYQETGEKINHIYYLIGRNPCIDPELGMYYTQEFFKGEVPFNISREAKIRNEKVVNISRGCVDLFLAGCDFCTLRKSLRENQLHPAVVITNSEGELKHWIFNDPLITKMYDNYYWFLGDKMLIHFDHYYDLVTWPESEKERYAIPVPPFPEKKEEGL